MHHGTGTIARLPEDVRTIVNQMIADGKPQQLILAKLAELGHPDVKRFHLTSWLKEGYPDWYARRESRPVLTEFNAFVVKHAEKGDLTAALLQFASSQIIDALKGLGPAGWADIISEKKEVAARLLGSLVVITKQTAALQAAEHSTLSSKPSTAQAVTTQSIQEIREKLFL